jgi:hypothetical protein
MRIHRLVGRNNGHIPHQRIFAELESKGMNLLIRLVSLVVLEVDTMGVLVLGVGGEVVIVKTCMVVPSLLWYRYRYGRTRRIQRVTLVCRVSWELFYSILLHLS